MVLSFEKPKLATEEESRSVSIFICIASCFILRANFNASTTYFEETMWPLAGRWKWSYFLSKAFYILHTSKIDEFDPSPLLAACTLFEKLRLRDEWNLSRKIKKFAKLHSFCNGNLCEANFLWNWTMDSYCFKIVICCFGNFDKWWCGRENKGNKLEMNSIQNPQDS